MTTVFGWRLPLWIALLGVALAQPAGSQGLGRPSDERPQLPEFSAPESELEILEPVLPPEGERLSAGPRIHVRGFRVEGSTVFTPEEIDRTLRPWVDRTLDTMGLQDAADALTALYVGAGYAGSGAVLPDQEVADGIVAIRVVEATLADVLVEGNRWLRDGYLRRRILAAVGTPVNLRDVEQALQLLLEERVVKRAAAELRPGLRFGETVLALRLEEGLPLGVEAIVGNSRPPAIGEISGQSLFHLDGPTGWGDALDVGLEFTEGLDSQEVRYAIPVNGYGTTLGLRYQRTASKIVEDFEDLDIESETNSASVTLRHPLLWTPHHQLWLGLRGEWRRNQTQLLGRDFSFEPGAEGGRTTVAVIRAIQDWILRRQHDVVAARSIFSVGVDALGATIHSGDLADGRYFAWLGQLQWAHLLPATLRSSQIIFRTDIQVASESLLTLERFAVGGHQTVRGYRENHLVRDNGLVSSLELRIPIVRDLLGDDVLSFAPFADFGHSWNVEQTEGKRTLASLGVGLLYGLGDRLDLEAYWGGRLVAVDREGHTLQDDGVYLQLRLRAL